MVCANATCCHKLPLISFWNTTGQHTLQIKHILSNMLYKSGSGWTFQHVWIGSMRFSILRYAEEIVTRCCWLWVILQGILRHFKGRMLWCVFFSSQLKNSHAILNWMKRSKRDTNSCFWKMYRHSISWTMTTNKTKRTTF